MIFIFILIVYFFIKRKHYKVFVLLVPYKLSFTRFAAQRFSLNYMLPYLSYNVWHISYVYSLLIYLKFYKALYFLRW